MSSPISRISDETLTTIIEYIAEYTPGSELTSSGTIYLRQCRLVCKQWNKIAEMYLFKTIHTKDIENIDSPLMKQFISKPERFALVQSVIIDSLALSTFEQKTSKLFHRSFPNVERLRLVNADWSSVSRGSKSSRCKLKYIAPPLITEDHCRNPHAYLILALKHRTTLESLVLDDRIFHHKDISEALQHINEFESLKDLTMSTKQLASLQDYDRLIDNLSATIEVINIAPMMSRPAPPEDFTLSKPHNKRMRIVRLATLDNMGSTILHYFLQKFPNAETIEVEQLAYGAQGTRIDTGIIQNLMKANQFMLRLNNSSSQPLADIYISLPETVTASICFDYLSPHPMGFQFGHATSESRTIIMHYNRWKRLDINKRAPWLKTFVHCQSPLNPSQNIMDYLFFVEKAGYTLKGLDLRVHNEHHKTSRYLKEGGDFWHALHFCKSLKEFRYMGDIMDNITFLFENPPSVHYCLEHVTLFCKLKVTVQFMTALSYLAPRIQCLHLIGRTADSSPDAHTAAYTYQVHMPCSSFKDLAISPPKIMPNSAQTIYLTIEDATHEPVYFSSTGGKVKQIDSASIPTQLSYEVENILIVCQSIAQFSYVAGQDSFICVLHG